MSEGVSVTCTGVWMIIHSFVFTDYGDNTEFPLVSARCSENTWTSH